MLSRLVVVISPVRALHSHFNSALNWFENINVLDTSRRVDNPGIPRFLGISWVCGVVDPVVSCVLSWGMLCLLNQSKLRLPVKSPVDELRNRRKEDFSSLCRILSQMHFHFLPTTWHTTKLLKAFERLELCKRSKKGFHWKLHCINLRSSGLMMCRSNFYSVIAVVARELDLFWEEKFYGHLSEISQETQVTDWSLCLTQTLFPSHLFFLRAIVRIWGHPYQEFHFAPLELCCAGAHQRCHISGKAGRICFKNLQGLSSASALCFLIY